MLLLEAESCQLLGVDFTSAPSARKPITVARGCLSTGEKGGVVTLVALQTLASFAAFEALLLQPGPWLAACDFPFGLPRAFVDAHKLGTTAAAVNAEVHQQCATRLAFRAWVDAWGNTQPAGQRLLHRRTDKAQPGVSSTSPLQTRYVPVGFMYFEGLRRLLAAHVTLPGQCAGDPQRVALEGYPGLLAFDLIGKRSYKNSSEPDRRQARADMLDALCAGSTNLRLALHLNKAQRGALLADNSGDLIDAVLCLMQAAWASTQPRFGQPTDVDPVEGWITSAGFNFSPNAACG